MSEQPEPEVERPLNHFQCYIFYKDGTTEEVLFYARRALNDWAAVDLNESIAICEVNAKTKSGAKTLIFNGDCIKKMEFKLLSSEML